MKTQWTAGLTPDQRKEMVEDFKSSSALRARLVDLLTKKKDSLRKDNISRDTYNSPSWAMLQADGIGYERALNEVISLLEEDLVSKNT